MLPFMPFVRRRGNHVAIVHGSRNPETKKVEQRVLVSLHSKREANAAIGRTADGSDQRLFRHLLEDRFPELRFSWPDLDPRIAELAEDLPDFGVREEDDTFRTALTTFARRLVATNPQELDSARNLLELHRDQLEWIARLIEWRLTLLDRTEASKWSQDRFGWRLALGAETVDPEIEEEASNLMESGDLERAESIFMLLTEAYPDYAEGWNYLGLISLQLHELPDALACFEKTEQIGRTLFPKRIRKDEYWTRLETRPYMRGLSNQCITLLRMRRYGDVKRIASQLRDECGDDVGADSHLAAACLCLGEWQRALELATRLAEIMPSESLVASFAAYELGITDLAKARFAHALANAPRTVGIVLGKNTGRAESYTEVKDAQGGLSLRHALGGYMEARSTKTKRFFSRAWSAQSELRDEVIAIEREIDSLRNSNPARHREVFDRLNRLRSWPAS